MRCRIAWRREKPLHYANSRSPKHHRRTPSKRMLTLGALAPPSPSCVICPTFAHYTPRSTMMCSHFLFLRPTGNRAGSQRQNSQLKEKTKKNVLLFQLLPVTRGSRLVSVRSRVRTSVEATTFFLALALTIHNKQEDNDNEGSSGN